VRRNGRHFIMGAAWGAPISAVEVQIDNGPWLAARLHSHPQGAAADIQTDGRATADSLDTSVSHRRSSRGYAWRFWKLNWGRPAPGEHMIRSRAFDIYGNVQPAPNEPFLASKRTYWESNGQITRRVRVQ
jgi:hypothetical protein